MQFYDYKGFTIYPMPRLIVDTNNWSLHFTIRRGNRGKSFVLPRCCVTKGEAVFECVSVGKKVIDGEMFGFSITDLH